MAWFISSQRDMTKYIFPGALDLQLEAASTVYGQLGCVRDVSPSMVTRLSGPRKLYLDWWYLDYYIWKLYLDSAAMGS